MHPFASVVQGCHGLVGKKHPFHGILSFGGIFLQRIDGVHLEVG